MSAFLNVVGLLAWLMAAFAFFTAIEGRGTDIQLILAGVYGTFGAVAIAGGGIISAIEDLRKSRLQPTDMAPPGPVHKASAEDQAKHGF